MIDFGEKWLYLIQRAACATTRRSTDIFTSTKLQDHMVARTYCEWCPVMAECLTFMDPTHNQFDGTAGGRFFINGKDVTIDEKFLKLTQYRHSQVSHNRIKAALLGNLALNELTPSDKMVLAYAAFEQGVSFTKITKWLGVKALVLHAILTIVEHDAPADTIMRARRWPVTDGNIKISRPYQARPRASSAKSQAG